jgi:hypothetical protein
VGGRSNERKQVCASEHEERKGGKRVISGTDHRPDDVVAEPIFSNPCGHRFLPPWRRVAHPREYAIPGTVVAPERQQKSKLTQVAVFGQSGKKRVWFVT